MVLAELLGELTDIIEDVIKLFVEPVLKLIIENLISVEGSFFDSIKEKLKNFLVNDLKLTSLFQCNKLCRVKILVFIFNFIVSIVAIPLFLIRLFLSVIMLGSVFDLFFGLIIFLSYIIALVPFGYLISKNITFLFNFLQTLFINIIV